MQAERLVSFLSRRQWLWALSLSVLCGIITWSLTAGGSPWLATTVALTVLICCHLAFSSRHLVPLPHIALLIASLQYVLAAWVSSVWRPLNPTYDVGDNSPQYLSYAGPVLLGLTAGWFLSLLRLGTVRVRTTPSNSALLLELDLLLAIGVVAAIVSRFIHVESLAFALLLLGNLRYVGVFGRMVVKGPGWGWRLALVLGAQAMLAASSTMFHDLLLWSAWTLAVWLFVFKPKPQWILAIIALSVLLLPALQEAKWRVRDGPLDDDPLTAEATAEEPFSIGRTVDWLGYLAPAFWRTITGKLDPDFIGETAVRYNQGWIINRVMQVVPEMEPYARGETLKNAAVAALLPRLIAPNKEIMGGREEMLQYANMDIGGTTAMTLGFAGEMYANFGLWGGVLGCGLYALFFGLLFRWFCNRAFRHPLWWSLVPFVFYAALKAEDDIAFVLNWTVKAAIVAAAVVIALPNFRRAFFGPIPAEGRLAGVQVGPARGDSSRAVPLALR